MATASKDTTPAATTPEATDIVGRAFQRAEQLRSAKEKVYEQIAANRRFLRDLSTQGLLTPEQDAAVLELYPPKSRGDSDES